MVKVEKEKIRCDEGGRTRPSHRRTLVSGSYRKIKGMKVGDKATLSKAFSEEEVVRFSAISTDTNPIHLDERFAASSRFGERIVHGMMVASLFSGLIGVELPGKGSIYLGQNLTFKAPVFIGEKITATVEIINIREDKPIITLRTICINQSGKVVVEGEAVVKAE